MRRKLVARRCPPHASDAETNHSIVDMIRARQDNEHECMHIDSCEVSWPQYLCSVWSFRLEAAAD